MAEEEVMFFATTPYIEMAYDMAEAYQLEPVYFLRLITQESNWDPTAVSSSGCIGLGQLCPEYHVPAEGTTLADPRENLRLAAEFLHNLDRYYGGDLRKALAAYNWGPGNVNRAVKKNPSHWETLLPRETRYYLDVIVKNVRSMKFEILEGMS